VLPVFDYLQEPMKAFYHLLFILILPLIQGCGQPGPLYLPTEKPPIHVEPEPEPEPETDESEAKQEKNK
jgi:predicted small lipoprotein YifL